MIFPKKKKNIYRVKNKRKYIMYFEKLKGKEKKEYMEEKNLKNYNISELTAAQLKSLSHDTQIKIMSDLIEKYSSNTEIAKHTKIGRLQLGALRKILGFEPARKGKQKTKPNKQVNKVNFINKNDVEIKISFKGFGTNNFKNKLESMSVFLEDNKIYDIEFILRERD